MTLNDLIDRLCDVAEEGHGDMPVTVHHADEGTVVVSPVLEVHIERDKIVLELGFAS